MLAAVDEAADSDRVADLEARNLGADGADVADNLVPGNAGVERAAPFGADRVKVGMADAAKSDLDLDVARSGLAALDGDRLERLVGGVSAIRFGCHGQGILRGFDGVGEI